MHGMTLENMSLDLTSSLSQSQLFVRDCRVSLSEMEASSMVPPPILSTSGAWQGQTIEANEMVTEGQAGSVDGMVLSAADGAEVVVRANRALSTTGNGLVLRGSGDFQVVNNVVSLAEQTVGTQVGIAVPDAAQSAASK